MVQNGSVWFVETLPQVFIMALHLVKLVKLSSKELFRVNETLF